jgi:hypothetical protein
LLWNVGHAAKNAAGTKNAVGVSKSRETTGNRDCSFFGFQLFLVVLTSPRLFGARCAAFLAALGPEGQAPGQPLVICCSYVSTLPHSLMGMMGMMNNGELITGKEAFSSEHH